MYLSAIDQPASRPKPEHELEDRKGGFPHSEIAGSKGASASPALIAACHVLHRLSAPRHPSEALQRLIVSQQNPCMDGPTTGKKCRRIRCLVLLARRCLLEHDLEPYERRSNSSFTMSMRPAGRAERKLLRDLRAGGARRSRTDDILLAKQALYQLSYGPVQSERCEARRAVGCRGHASSGAGRPGQTRTADLTLIRRTL